ncbi:MAG: hypothetical protein F4X58_07770 [Chloroflexi bacterium]|nr:hypothetical protein [Chloroflexota bacterium]MYC01806.1 hypothetical protein [Chloroflexota bacterium]
MPVTFLDPTAESGLEIEPYELFADTSGPITVGLLSNAFPDGAEFMHKLEAELADIMPQASFRHYQKPNVAAVTEDLIPVITEECDVVLAAWGH